MSFFVKRGRQAVRFSHLVATFSFMWLVYHGQRGNRWGTHRRALWQKRFAAHLLRVMHLKVETRGLPPEGSFIAANHQGYMDILVMASQTPQVFLSKHSVADWPFIGTFVKMAGTLFIDRARRQDVSTQEQGFANAIEQSVGMTVYLEGTSSDGSQILPFKSSLLDPVVRNQWDVTPAYLKYECEGGNSALDVCWWGDMTFGRHLLKMMTLKSIRATIVFGETRHPGTDRKRLAKALHADVLALGSLAEGRDSPLSKA